MAAILPEWPIEQPLVVADDITMLVTINTPQDIAGWVWEAAVRATPSGPVVARWTVTVDAVAKKLTLRLPEVEAAKCVGGYGFDLRQTEPVNFTWLTVKALNLIPSYSYEAP